jgi:hypothetical protein
MQQETGFCLQSEGRTDPEDPPAPRLLWAGVALPGFNWEVNYRASHAVPSLSKNPMASGFAFHYLRRKQWPQLKPHLRRFGQILRRFERSQSDRHQNRLLAR